MIVAWLSATYGDPWRVATVSLGWMIVGVMFALFQRFFRWGVPRTVYRLGFGSALVIVSVSNLDVASRIGDPLTWRTPLLFFAYVANLWANVVFYVWTRRPEGRKIRHAMIAQYKAAQMLREEGLKP